MSTQIEMTPSEILNAIADKVEADPSTWTQGGFAKNAVGVSVEVDDVGAICWCALGYISKITKKTIDEYSIAQEYLKQEVMGTGATSILKYNDFYIKTPQEFVSWFRAAAKIAETEGN